MLDYDSIYSFFRNIVPDGAEWLVFAITGFTLAFIVINVATGITAVYTWFERRALGRFQSRLGPNRWGPFGSLQPMADLLKLLTKEDTVPETADRPVMTLAPILMAAPALVVFGLIPLGPDSFLGRVNVGLLFILGISSSHVLAIFMAGWGSRNKYAMFGAERGVAMLLSYEVPMALALVGPVMLAGSISLLGIVNGQSVAYLFVQPTAFLVFVIAGFGRDESHAFRHDRVGVRAGRRVPHRVQRHQVRHIPARRVHGAYRRLGNRHRRIPGVAPGGRT